MRTDWLPSSRTGQLAMAQNWVSILNNKAQAWGIPNQFVTKLESLVEQTQDALYDAISSARNAVINQQMRTAFGNLTDHMRDIRRRHFFMPPLTEADWVSLGLRLPDTIPTPIGPPTSVVMAEVSYPHKNSLALSITPMPGHRYDTRAEWGFRIYYGVLPQIAASEEMTIERQYLRREPERPEELTNSYFTRRRHSVIEFEYDNSGMKCFMCVRYENGKGDKGPWGPMVSSFIP